MKKVLIVDDALFMRVMLKNILEKHQFEVVGEAGNGAEAVKAYEKLHPDIVTLDITMPQMDGLAALQEIRNLDPNSKVVMVSAMGQESNVKKAISIGAKSFLVKPFQEDHVIKTLNNI
ncbi:response regulator [Clostridium cellulovorans]|uniref:Stage 0 sporulation protein A homolog n=1 Tax=Clostridium cellulovorans (strain ATCC 35296 / DSM 3052 / OCM 3 / 743B) TaxID=573061 RepID=D9SU13_CLOC7|nr:response regulator [Clostridium cellulovorans]ADL50851.1 response regulator receiver protein [Clostridium cellulovorans 743B]